MDKPLIAIDDNVIRMFADISRPTNSGNWFKKIDAATQIGNVLAKVSMQIACRECKELDELTEEEKTAVTRAAGEEIVSVFEKMRSDLDIIGYGHVSGERMDMFVEVLNTAFQGLAQAIINAYHLKYAAR